MLSHRAIGAAALSFCAGLIVSTANAEIFQRVLGDQAREHTFSINRTDDGGYITTGYRDAGAAAPDEDVLITKHKSDGSIEWQRLWRGPGRDIGYSVQQTFDGGYIVAAESTSSGIAGMNILLIRLDAAGLPVWNNFYTGGFSTDPIHTPHPGVALDQGFEGEIYVTGNVGGLPMVLAVEPVFGGMMWSATYEDPAGPDGLFRYAFTDIKFDRIDGTLVVSGTSLRPDFNQPGGLLAQDAFLMRTTATGVPIWSWNYDFPFDLFPDDGDNVRETGDGLDIGPDGDIILNGRTDFGGLVDPVGTHLVATDRAGMITWSAEYTSLNTDGTTGRHASAYAAVRWDDDLNIVQTGRLPSAAGVFDAWISLTRLGGDPIWFWTYGEQNNTRGESVIPTPDPCGYAMAGRFEFMPPMAPFFAGETYLVKTNKDGETGCLEQRWDFRRDFHAQALDAPIRHQYRQGFFPAPNLLAAADAVEHVPCYDDNCNTGLPCPCDLNGDGVRDLTDVMLFITSFTMMTPPSDLAPPFGVWDINDIIAFIDCFTSAHCP